MTTSRGVATYSDLLATPIDELASAAFAKARSANGYVVTYSPKVFIPLTKLCRDRCGYCTFAQAPAHVDSPYMSLDEVMAVAQAGRDAGCTEALFTLGERPELRYDEAARWLAARGYESTVDYVANAAQMVLESTGLLPHANAGALYRHELAQLRTVSASQGMMVEALADLAAHRLAPDKDPQRRLDTLRFAGELKIPFTTGLLVGIGETREERIATLAGDRRVARGVRSRPRGDHPELPAQAAHRDGERAGRERRGVPLDDRRRAPDPARLDPPPGATELERRSDEAARLRHRRLRWHLAGHGRSRQPRAGVAGVGRALGDECDARGFNLEPRLTVYPDYVGTKSGFLDEKVRPYVLAHADSTFLARNDVWASGTEVTPPGSPDDAVAYERGHVAPRALRAGLRVRPPGADHALPRARRRLQRRGRARRRRTPGPRRRRRDLRDQPQHQLHQRLHLQVPILRLLQGPALAQPARRPLPVDARRDQRARARGRRAWRDRGLSPGRHPPEVRRRLLHRRGRRGARGLAHGSTSTPSAHSRSSRARAVPSRTW